MTRESGSHDRCPDAANQTNRRTAPPLAGPRSRIAQFTDPVRATYDAAAMLGPVKACQDALANGDQIVIITGRDQRHQEGLTTWAHTFLGSTPTIVTRPNHVPVACQAQAQWKAGILRELDVTMYIGDNPRIDAVAAKIAGIRYRDVANLRQPNLVRNHELE